MRTVISENKIFSFIALLSQTAILNCKDILQEGLLYSLFIDWMIHLP